MTPDQKEKIYKLRMQGLGYKAIAGELLLTVDTVKGYCKRHHLNGQVESIPLNTKVASALCLHCKKLIRPKKRGRTKKFCCDSCRYTWCDTNNSNGGTVKWRERCPTCANRLRVQKARVKERYLSGMPMEEIIKRAKKADPEIIREWISEIDSDK